MTNNIKGTKVTMNNYVGNLQTKFNYNPVLCISLQGAATDQVNQAKLLAMTLDGLPT